MSEKDRTKLIKQIEELRKELIKYVDQSNGNFLNKNVLVISTALDKLIYEYQSISTREVVETKGGHACLS